MPSSLQIIFFFGGNTPSEVWRVSVDKLARLATEDYLIDCDERSPGYAAAWSQVYLDYSKDIEALEKFLRSCDWEQVEPIAEQVYPVSGLRSTYLKSCVIVEGEED